MTLKKPQIEKTSLVQNRFVYIFKIAGALLLPLFVVFLLKYFFHLEKKQVLYILPISFICSLFLLYRMYRYLSQRVKEIQLAAEKQKQDQEKEMEDNTKLL